MPLLETAQSVGLGGAGVKAFAATSAWPKPGDLGIEKRRQETNQKNLKDKKSL